MYDYNLQKKLKNPIATGLVQRSAIQHGEDFAEDLPGAGAFDREDEGGGAGDEEPPERAGVFRDQVSGSCQDAELVKFKICIKTISR